MQVKLDVAFPKAVRKLHQSFVLPQPSVAVSVLLVEGDSSEILFSGFLRLVVEVSAQLDRDRWIVFRVQDQDRAGDLTQPLR